MVKKRKEGLGVRNYFLLSMLFLLTVVGMGIVFSQGAPNPGHLWSEITCTNCVSNGNIQDNAVGNSELQDNSVSNAKLQNDAVNSIKIQDGTVGNVDLAPGGIHVSKISGNNGWYFQTPVLTPQVGGSAPASGWQDVTWLIPPGISDWVPAAGSITIETVCDTPVEFSIKTQAGLQSNTVNPDIIANSFVYNHYVALLLPYSSTAEIYDKFASSGGQRAKLYIREKSDGSTLQVAYGYTGGVPPNTAFECLVKRLY